MDILELETPEQKDKLLAHLPNVDWGVARALEKTLKTDTIKEKLGKDARIFYVKDGQALWAFLPWLTGTIFLTQHKGLYEKMGYRLFREFTGSIHDKDYLYEKYLG